ncbi:MAG: hypothetical protein ACRC46_00590 [Thermoguttaceae bacterium]
MRVCILFMVCLATSSISFGQTPPPLSPWLLLNNRPQGAIDNYNMWVKPVQDTAAKLSQQQSEINRQGAMLRQAPSSGSGTTTGGRGAAGFRYYGHWYSGLPGDPTPHRAR